MITTMWTCVYGEDNYFNILRTSLESLSLYGNYKGNFCIFSDRSSEETIKKYVPADMWLRTMVLPFPSTPNLSSRYECANYLPKHYDVYLYVDTDIIYDNDINPVLLTIANSNKICFSSEAVLYPQMQKTIGELRKEQPYNCDWFGLNIASEDTRYDSHRLPLINSGIIGSSDIVKLIDVCNLITLKIGLTDPAYIKEFSDQSVVNYVMTSYGCDTGITRYVHFANATPPEEHIRVGLGLRGMMHFLWSGKQKLDNMVAYSAIIAKVKA